MIDKRANMHIYNPDNCTANDGGVDLNRNYDFMFNEGWIFETECE